MFMSFLYVQCTVHTSYINVYMIHTIYIIHAQCIHNIIYIHNTYIVYAYIFHLSLFIYIYIISLFIGCLYHYIYIYTWMYCEFTPDICHMIAQGRGSGWSPGKLSMGSSQSVERSLTLYLMGNIYINMSGNGLYMMYSTIFHHQFESFRGKWSVCHGD